MFGWGTNYQLGLDWGSKNLKFMELKQGGEVPWLENWGVKEWPGQEEKVVIDFLTQLQDQYSFNTRQVTINSSGQELILKKITVPEVAQKELSQLINWELNDILPVSPDEMIVDYEVLSSSGETKEVLVAAAQQKLIKRKIKLLKEAGFKVVSVAPEPLVLKRPLAVVNNQPARLAILDLGAKKAELVGFTDGEFAFRRSFKFGGRKFTTAVKDQQGVSRRQAEEYKQTAEVEDQLLDQLENKLITEIERSFQYHDQERIDQLLLTGGAAKLQPLQDRLAAGLEVETALLNSLAAFQFTPERFDPYSLRENLPELGVSLGLALRGRSE